MSEDEVIPDQKPIDHLAGVKAPSPDTSLSKDISSKSTLPSQTSNLKSETSNMETHAHHLHKAPGRKLWHYFFEFFMLFLAVTLGFFVENQREHFVEQIRSKEYAEGLLRDLTLDRDELSRGMRHTKFIIGCIDSLVKMTARENIVSNVPGRFYYYSTFTTATFRIDWSKSTIDQLVQSGSLRYFRDKELVDMINFYYYIQGIIAAQNQMDMTQRDNILSIRNAILKSNYYSIFSNIDAREESKGHVASPEIDSLIATQLSLQRGASERMDDFVNNICDRKLKLKPVLENYYTVAEETSTKIIERLKRDFDLRE